ncbi:hypothetical protein WJX84_004169 [Apatococcus fuscideae]|uniref:Uncharacterized protein n=1 Tax=Apatococcus fuscideae TaxID=2026836 RepID=A0AAW1S8Q2_9CHLO
MHRAAVQCSQTSTSGSQLDCNFSIESNEHCVLEAAPDGTPVRKCERLIRRLRQCPGRLPEVIETIAETRSDTECSSSAMEPYNREARAENSVGAEALGRNVGEAFEEFVKFTEELKHRGSGDVQETLQLEPPAPQQPSRPDQFLQSDQNHLPSDTFFGRLFGRQRLRKSEHTTKAWEKYGDIEVV